MQVQSGLWRSSSHLDLVPCCIRESMPTVNERKRRVRMMFPLVLHRVLLRGVRCDTHW